ncbi:MAG: cytochrome c [Acidobacteria bacterium]|nr:cytochrome c [Acidobacteriota bacterium]
MRAVPLLLLSSALLAQAPPSRGVEELRRFYADNCVRCHGTDGSATSPEGKPLKGQSFLDRRTMDKKSDEELAKTILKGLGFGFVMPKFKDQLSPEEAKRLVTELIRKAEKGRPL